MTTLNQLRPPLPARSILALTVAWILPLLAGCGAEPAAQSTTARLQGDAEVLRAVLKDLARLEKTPTATLARRMLASIDGCSGTVVSETEISTDSAAAVRQRQSAVRVPPGLNALIDGLSCVDLPADGRLQDQVKLELPLRSADGEVLNGQVLTGLLVLGVTGPELTFSLAEPARRQPWSWGLPDDSGALRRLRRHEALVHGVWKSRHGLDFASWVEADSELDTLWGLKTELLSKAVLDGGMEAVIYLPVEGRAMPDMVVALGVRNRQAAATAAAAMAEQIAETWSVQRTPLKLASAEGLCLTDLRILPELSPCFVVTDHQWILGWNRSSLERALAERPGAGEKIEPGHRIEVDLSLFPKADRRIQRALGAAGSPPMTYPWRRLVVDAGRNGSDYRFHLSFETAEVTP